MNIKELILKDMPDDLNDLEKARYIYLKLAITFNFSTKLQNTNKDEYTKMYIKEYNLENITSNKIICSAFAQIYSKLLDELNIKNRIINQGHKYVSFEYDNKIWIADAASGNLYSDMSRIRYGDKTNNFGVCIHQNYDNIMPFINPNNEYDLDLIDQKFSFYQDRKRKYNILEEELNKIKDMPLTTKKKLEYIFKLVGTLYDGYYESKDFIRHLEYKFLSKEEINKIHARELKRTNKNKEVDIIQCIYIEDDDNYTYYLLAPNMEIKEVNNNDITKLAILGYGIEKEIPNVFYPKKFIPGKVSKDIKYFLQRRQVPKELKEHDIEQNKKM